jgi:hypothetical protein
VLHHAEARHREEQTPGGSTTMDTRSVCRVDAQAAALPVDEANMSRRLVVPSVLVSVAVAGATVGTAAAPASDGVRSIGVGLGNPLRVVGLLAWDRDKDHSTPPGQGKKDPPAVPGPGGTSTGDDDGPTGETGDDGVVHVELPRGSSGRGKEKDEGNGDGTTTSATPPAAPSSPSQTASEPKAERGRKGVASTPTGTVTVKVPGASQPVVMTADTPVPTGSTIDASKGTVELETVVDVAGHTQRARFRGTTFRIQLSRETGMVDLYLVGKPATCGARAASIRAVGRATRTARSTSLWGKDSNGKYRTHGRNSVATVRGTVWSTTETCAGTVTRVMKGSVSVVDKHSGRRTLVRAGHSHLARTGA